MMETYLYLRKNLKCKCTFIMKYFWVILFLGCLCFFCCNKIYRILRRKKSTPLCSTDKKLTFKKSKKYIKPLNKKEEVAIVHKQIESSSPIIKMKNKENIRNKTNYEEKVKDVVNTGDIIIYFY